MLRRCLLDAQERTSLSEDDTSEKCHGTKSLRSSPLRGSKSRDTGSQVRG